jgi:RNA polymerase sigma-70 factor (ECF subfamily)
MVRRDHLKQTSDAALVVAIGRWCQDALAEAYRRHAGAVFAIARGTLGSHDSAENVVQEVFVRLWNSPERFDPERGSLRSWLLSQAHGRAVDMLRSDSSRRRREERDQHRAATHVPDIEREVLEGVVGDQVRELLDRLRPGEREAIELAYFGGHTYCEVAAALDQPEGTVKSRIRSGLVRLRQGLVEAGIEAP